MRRRWVILLLCVLLGAVVNVVVAWIADQLPVGAVTMQMMDAENHHWTAPVPVSWPESPPTAASVRLLGRSVYITAADRMTRTDRGTLRVAVCEVQDWRCGWPLPSLRRYAYTSTERSWPPPGGFQRNGKYEWALRLPASFRGPKPEQGWLALQPLWPGFAANTLLYAAVIWIPLRGVGILRRRRRVHQGRCPACGYEQSGLKAGTPCPECGGTGARA